MKAIGLVIIIILYGIGVEASGYEKISYERLKNATYQMGQITVTLNGGHYETPSPQPGDISVDLGPVAWGDLDNDKKEDAVVILNSHFFGGNASDYDLAVVINRNGTPYNVTTANLGDRVNINSISIQSGVIIVDMLTHSPDDGACCPSLHTIIKYRLIGEELKRATTNNKLGGDITDNEAISFVKEFLEASKGGDIDNLLKMYADEVNFHGENYTKDEIRQDKINYYNRWPIVNSKIDGRVTVKKGTNENEKEVRFLTKFYAHNQKNKTGVSGGAENILVLRKIDNGLKIISEKQNVIQREKY